MSEQEQLLGRPCGTCRGRGGVHGPDCLNDPAVPPPPAAPDATAGDGLRSDEWWTRLFLAVEELVSSVPYTDGSKWPVPHAAAFRAAVEPALRDVLAAAARDAEKVRAAKEVRDFVRACAVGIAPTHARVYLDIARRLSEALDPS